VSLITFLTRALRRHQTWALEYFLAWQSLVWGAWLLMPFGSFEAVPGAFTVLGIIPEPVWGVLFFGHGCAYLWALWNERTELCRRAALILGGLWLAVFLSLVLTIPWATSTPVYGVYVIACAWVYARLDWYVQPPRGGKGAAA